MFDIHVMCYPILKREKKNKEKYVNIIRFIMKQEERWRKIKNINEIFKIKNDLCIITCIQRKKIIGKKGKTTPTLY